MALENRVSLTPQGDLLLLRRAPLVERVSWALYDFANTIFSMNVVTLYFAVWLIEDLGSTSTYYALATSLSSLLVAASIPVLGAVSDLHRRRKPWVIGFTIAACAATAGIGVLGSALGDSSQDPTPHLTVALILLCFVIANYCFQGALPFYNAMLPELVPPSERGRLSGYGTALGYLGAIAGVLLVAPFVTGAVPILGPLPPRVVETLRLLPFTEEGGRAAAFVPTALLFLLFSLPVFLFTRDHLPVPRAEHRRLSLGEPLARVVEALRDTRRYPGLLRFVVASYFYQDVLGTIAAFMAVYAVVAMGFKEGAEITLFVVLTVPAIVGSCLAGILADRIGPRRTLLGVMWIWVGLLVCVIAVRSQGPFWAVGALIGLVFGGVWASERPLLLTLVPDAESGRFFGLLVLSARVAAIFGPLLWAVIVDHLFAPLGPAIAYRAAVGSLALLMLLAIAILGGVPERSARGSDPGSRGSVARPS